MKFSVRLTLSEWRCPSSIHFCLENRHILPISVKSLSYRCLRKNAIQIAIVKKHYSAVYHSKVAHLRWVTHRFSHQKQPFLHQKTPISARFYEVKVNRS